MKIVGREEVDEFQDEDDAVSLCSMFAGEESFGIDTSKIREVLGKRELQRVPMAPAFIAGVVPYRGEVLTTVNFRALLGMEESGGEELRVGDGGRRGCGAVRPGGGCGGRCGDGEPKDAGGESVHAGGAG